MAARSHQPRSPRRGVEDLIYFIPDGLTYHDSWPDHHDRYLTSTARRVGLERMPGEDDATLRIRIRERFEY